MTVFIQSGNTQFDINQSNETYILSKGNTLTSDGNGINQNATYSNNTIQVDGAINAEGLGVYLGGPASTVTIGKQSVIEAFNGIAVMGRNTNLYNYGVVNTVETAIYMAGVESKFVNSGVITGEYGITSHDGASITNAAGATIDTGSIGIVVVSKAGESAVTLNAGTLKGEEFSFFGGLGNETFINRGRAEGTVSLGAGNDMFDGRGGNLKGWVSGGLGDDIYMIDKSDILINEADGGGIDQVSSTVSYTLADGVENMTLTGTAAARGAGNRLDNILTGNEAANRLSGGDGNDTLEGAKGTDTLKGGAGADILDGGRGRDILTGNADGDTFVFSTGYGRDRVTDFQNGSDHFDISDFRAIRNFSDLIHHHLKVSGDDLIVYAGDDRLVLEDTKKGELNASDFSF